MTDTGHAPTEAELRDLFRDDEQFCGCFEMKYSTSERWLRTYCDAHRPTYEITIPERTETACWKLTSHGLCDCTEFIAGGPKIGRDTEASCARCLDTPQSHKPRTGNKQTKRNGGLK